MGSGSAGVAAAKCSTHNTVDRVLDDEASELPRPGELVAEPTGSGDAPPSVLAPDVRAHRREHQRTQMYQRRHILNHGTAELDLCWHWCDHANIISLRPRDDRLR